MINENTKAPFWSVKALQRMKELKITQSDLLEVFNVNTRGAVGHYFTGRSIINVEQLDSLSQKLNLKLEYTQVTNKESTIATSDLESILDTWLVKLETLGFATYSIEKNQVRDLILFDIKEKLSEN